MLVHTKIAPLEEPEIEFGGWGFCSTRNSTKHKNAISWPFKVLGSQYQARKCEKILPRAFKGRKHSSRSHNFRAQDQFFRFLVSLRWSTKAQSRTLTTTLVFGTTRSRFINVLHRAHRNTKKWGKVKVGPFCLDCWAKRKSIFFKKNKLRKETNLVYVTASHRVERDAYEERHNRSLHLWACLGCVRWYVWLWISFWNFCRIHIGVPYKLDASSYFWTCTCLLLDVHRSPLSALLGMGDWIV